MLVNTLATVMRRIGEPRWPDLTRALTEGTAGAIDPVLPVEPMTRAEASRAVCDARDLVRTWERAAYRRRQVRSHVTDALASLGLALSALRELSEIEGSQYEEGGDQIKQFLEAATGSLDAIGPLKLRAWTE